MFFKIVSRFISYASFSFSVLLHSSASDLNIKKNLKAKAIAALSDAIPVKELRNIVMGYMGDMWEPDQSLPEKAHAVAISNDGNYIALSIDKLIYYPYLDTKKEIKILHKINDVYSPIQTMNINLFAGSTFGFSHNNKFLAAINGARVIIWTLKNGQFVEPLEEDYTLYPSGKSSYLSFSPHDDTLYTVLQGTELKEWTIINGKLKSVYLYSRRKPWKGLTNLSDGTLGLYSSQEIEIRKVVDDLAPITQYMAGLPEAELEPGALYITPKFAFIAEKSTGTIYRCDAKTCEPFQELMHAAKINDIAFSPNGKFIIASFANNTVQIYKNENIDFNEWQ